MISIAAMRIGDVVMLPMYPPTEADLKVGRVVYIHPKKRFFTLEYETLKGVKIRESFVPWGEKITCREGKGKNADKKWLSGVA